MSLPAASPEVIDGVREILSGLVLREIEEIRPETLLVQDLDVDSLGLIELIFGVEDRFGIKFPDLKTNAQMYGLPLPEALEQLESMEGGMTLLEFIKAAVVQNGEAPLAAEEADRRFRSATAADLCRAVGGPLPNAMAAETPLGEVYLVDAFRVITVDIFARYVEFLRTQPSASAE